MTAAMVLIAVVGWPHGVDAAGGRDGALDARFGTGGRVTTSFPSADGEIANALVVQGNGKLVAAGGLVRDDGMSLTAEFALARYHRSGRLDRSFGSRGLVTTHFSPTSVDTSTALVAQPDGKLVAAGFTSVDSASTDANFALARYRRNGSLDPSFGGGGLVITDFAGGNDQAFAMAVQADGKLVVAGHATAEEAPRVALARYDPDGSLDPSFGVGGLVITDAPDTGAQALVVQADGKLVVTGRGFVTMRFNGDGSLDPGFGSGGIAAPMVGGNAEALVVQADGKLVAAGEIFVEGVPDFALVRFERDGTLDATFGSGGVVTTDFAGSVDAAQALVAQPDGKLIAGGVALTSNAPDPDPSLNFGLARYDDDGSLDPSFGTGGIVITGFAGGGAAVFALALQADGKLVAAGVANGQSTSISGGDFGLARYHTSSRHHQHP